MILVEAKHMRATTTQTPRHSHLAQPRLCTSSVRRFVISLMNLGAITAAIRKMKVSTSRIIFFSLLKVNLGGTSTIYHLALDKIMRTTSCLEGYLLCIYANVRNTTDPACTMTINGLGQHLKVPPF